MTTCAACGAERDFPEGRATRVLEGDVIYADVLDPCECGAHRVRVDVTFDGDDEPPESGPLPK